jgi:hypothetical protein
MKKCIVVLLLGLLASGLASATTIFTGSSGNLSASIGFDVMGGNLVAILTNTSTADVMAPSDILTAVFFDVAGNLALSRVSANIASGSTVWFAPAGGSGPDVGGEWAYTNNLSGAPGGANQGISSSGLGLFAPSDRFGAVNLQGPISVDGIQYGITSAGDNSATGNQTVTGSDALIHNSVVFTLGGLPSNFNLSSISNVQFQYGAERGDPHFPGSSAVPEPATMALIGIGLVALRLVRPRLTRRSN